MTTIPAELMALPQWVVWTAPSKVPYSPTTGSAASSTDPATWGAYEAACAAATSNDSYAGIGFVFTEQDPYCGVDLDDCLSPDGQPIGKAGGIVGKLASYTEVSPSGTGLKVIMRAKKPGQRCKCPFEWAPGKSGQVEVYDSARYFTITGKVFNKASTIEPRQNELDRLYKYLFPVVQTTVVSTGFSQGNAVERCRRYLEKCPDSISGQNGHDKFFRAACECMRFGLSDADTLATLRWWSESKSGGEPWSEREMGHKIDSARDKCSAAGEIGVRLRDDRWQEPAVPVHQPEPPPGESVAGVLSHVGRIQRGEYYAVPWKWDLVGKLTQALLPGAVTTLCGAPGAGKTFFVLDAAIGWVEMGIPFKLFELEENRNYYLCRALALLENKSDMTDVGWVKDHADEVNAAVIKNAAILNKLGECIYDTPAKRVSLMSIADWYESVASTCRVVVIDPITAAATGQNRFIEDGAFMERVKTIALQSETSLVLVTHPKLGNRKGPPTMDDVAGGADYTRFSQTVMVLSSRDTAEPVMCRTPFGTTRQNPNRIITLRKTRNGRGDGLDIGFNFGGDSLSFRERGLVIYD